MYEKRVAALSLSLFVRKTCFPHARARGQIFFFMCIDINAAAVPSFARFFDIDDFFRLLTRAGEMRRFFLFSFRVRAGRGSRMEVAGNEVKGCD